MSDERAVRKRRANGEESRRRILDAAVAVAGERGYDGTSIAAVSKRCGLPASSIYWHFRDKDDLIAAVIERGFSSWLEAVSPPDLGSGAAPEEIVGMFARIAAALLDSPDFLRLGLMLALERRPTEPSARAMFLRVRETTRHRFAEVAAEIMPELDDADIATLTTYAIAGADGLFIAREIGGESVDLAQLLEFHARSIIDAARRLANNSR